MYKIQGGVMPRHGLTPRFIYETFVQLGVGLYPDMGLCQVISGIYVLNSNAILFPDIYLLIQTYSGKTDV
jgi:hypothetical protein